MDENKFCFTEEGSENDISANCVKYGFLYLQDQINHVSSSGETRTKELSFFIF
jgi:hypothetical protein